jgi:hypothetical protein
VEYARYRPSEPVPVRSFVLRLNRMLMEIIPRLPNCCACVKIDADGLRIITAGL